MPSSSSSSFTNEGRASVLSKRLRLTLCSKESRLDGLRQTDERGEASGWRRSTRGALICRPAVYPEAERRPPWRAVRSETSTDVFSVAFHISQLRVSPLKAAKGLPHRATEGALAAHLSLACLPRKGETAVPHSTEGIAAASAPALHS